MADKFTKNQTIIDTDWLNDVDHVVYDAQGNPIDYLPLDGSLPTKIGNIRN